MYRISDSFDTKLITGGLGESDDSHGFSNVPQISFEDGECDWSVVDEEI